MTFNAETRNGRRIICRIHIDHTSAGFAEAFGGKALITLAD
jgi:hypothetical protein